MWFKYRTKEASGGFKNSPWDWEYLGVRDRAVAEAEVKERITEINQAHDWTDLYRGVEYEILDEAPIEVLDHEIHKTNNQITGLNLYVATLQAQRARAAKSSKEWTAEEVLALLKRLVAGADAHLDEVSQTKAKWPCFFNVAFRYEVLGELKTPLALWIDLVDGTWEAGILTSEIPAVQGLQQYFSAMARSRVLVRGLLEAGVLEKHP